MAHWEMGKALVVIGVLLGLAVVCAAAPAYALGSRPQQNPGGKGNGGREALVRKLAANPKVKQPGALREAYAKGKTARLIIVFDPPGAMAGYATKEERVKAAQDRLIGALPPKTQQAVIRRFTTIYAFLVKATPGQLADILNNPDIRSVEADAKARPLGLDSVQ